MATSLEGQKLASFTRVSTAVQQAVEEARRQAAAAEAAASAAQQQLELWMHALLAGLLKVFGGQGGGQWRVAHKAFLRVCRLATCRLKSALESRFSATGSSAWLMM